MSIEALIQAHTEALRANTEAVNLLTLSLAGRSATAANKAADAVEKPKTESKPVKEEKKPDQKAEVVTSKCDLKMEVPVELDGEPVPYETVRSLVLKLAGAGKREEIKALNAKHGIANLKVLLDKEDDFNTVNDQAKLEAVYSDLQKLEG